MTFEPTIPQTNDDLADLHYDIAESFANSLIRLATSLAVLFGESTTRSAFASLLIPTSLPQKHRTRLLQDMERDGVAQFIHDQAPGGFMDTIENTVVCRDAAEYANQGCAPMERPDVELSLKDRERRILDLIENVARLRPCSHALIGPGYDYIWEAFDARKAIDGFGGKAPIKGLRVLASLPMAVIRTAASEGDLQPDQDGMLEPEAALAWLVRRRQFCPSRWRNLADDQSPLDPVRALAVDSENLLVPQDLQGKPFVPEFVVRPARGGGLSITIGKKGAETQLGDFHEALRQLSELVRTGDVPRWRRRNEVGNWGIVRARGAWVSVSKSEIARQLAALSSPGYAG
jgi:hypothetical protein